MIGYLDTSAFLPLLVAEPSSPSCRRFWDDADEVVSSRLLYVETAAALAQALRMHRLTDQEHAATLTLLDQMWSQIRIAEVDETLVERATALAHRFRLRGYDAVHCATAELLNDTEVTAATGDQGLLDAWAELAMATFDTNQSSAG